MRTHRSFFLTAAALSLPVLVLAKTFPDVPKSSPHYQAIVELSERGVITGNPDGTFKPGNPLTRAAMITLAYRSAGKTPDTANTNCFTDKLAEWYAAYACDAKAKGYVQGYANGSFGGEKTVSVAEALKMTLVIMDISVADTDATAVAALSLSDVDASAWFAKYAVSAYAKNILPLPDQEAGKLYPNDPLSRAQAASMIYAAWKAKGGISVTVSSSSVSSESVSSAAASASSSSSSAAATRTSSSSSSKAAVSAKPAILSVSFPFESSRAFEAKASISYKFTLKLATVADVSVTVDEGFESAGLGCNLYRIDNDGFTTEYYPGITIGRTCSMLAALAPGNYQIDLRTRQASVPFTIKAKTGKGDGNDGFSQARSLDKNTIRPIEVLGDTGDQWDYYFFMIKGDSEQRYAYRLETSSTSVIECAIYPDKGVDVYTEESSEGQPHCGSDLKLFPGKYYVSVGHGPNNRNAKQTYSIMLKELKK